MMNKNWFLLLTICCSPFFSFAQADLSLYESKVYEGKSGKKLPYRILFPKKYKPKKSYPLVLFLHGAGERGGDNELQLVHGAKLFLQKKNRRKYKSIVVFPQCSEKSYWAHMDPKKDNSRSFPDIKKPTQPLGLTIELLQSLIENESVDENRIYVMGLSMGGMGTFEILSRLPDTFAGAIPICGGGNLKLAENYAKKTNLWIFHGGKDDVVFPEYSRNMYKRLSDLGANVKYTEYPEANHNSWDPAFAEPKFLKWLFSNRK